MNGYSETVETIRRAKWHQGSIVSSDSTAQIASIVSGPVAPPFSESDWCIVLSHDCDILSPDLQKEPWIEIIVARPVGKGGGDPAFRNGRNPRRIHFAAQIGDWPFELEASIHDRGWLARERLANLSPDPRRTLAPGVRRILAQWVAKRYVRSGFPDAFNDRLKHAEKKFRRFLKTHDPHLRALFVVIDPDEELPPEDPYRCALVLVYPAEWDDPDRREAMVKQLRKILESCPGLDVAGVTARSTEEFTLQDQGRFRRLDFDFLSYAEDDPVLPPESVDLE